MQSWHQVLGAPHSGLMMIRLMAFSLSLSQGTSEPGLNHLSDAQTTLLALRATYFAPERPPTCPVAWTCNLLGKLVHVPGNCRQGVEERGADGGGGVN